MGSYPTFSPLPLRAVILCYIISAVTRQLPVKKYGALCCPDFPPDACASGDRPMHYLYFSLQSYNFSRIFSSIGTKKVITIRKHVLEAYYHSFPCHKSIVCCNYPDRGNTSVTAGKRSRQASVTRGYAIRQILYPEVGST